MGLKKKMKEKKEKFAEKVKEASARGQRSVRARANEAKEGLNPRKHFSKRKKSAVKVLVGPHKEAFDKMLKNHPEANKVLGKFITRARRRKGSPTKEENDTADTARTINIKIGNDLGQHKKGEPELCLTVEFS